MRRTSSSTLPLQWLSYDCHSIGGSPPGDLCRLARTRCALPTWMYERQARGRGRVWHPLFFVSSRKRNVDTRLRSEILVRLTCLMPHLCESETITQHINLRFLFFGVSEVCSGTPPTNTKNSAPPDPRCTGSAGLDGRRGEASVSRASAGRVMAKTTAANASARRWEQ